MDKTIFTSLSEYAVEFIQKHNLPDIIVKAVGFINLNTSENTMTVVSEDVGNIRDIVQSGNIDEIRESRLAWQTLCVVIYDRAKQLIENVDHSQDFVEFVNKLEESNQKNLEFMPENSRGTSLYKDVLGVLEIVEKIANFVAKAMLLQLTFLYLSGGIVLYSFPESPESGCFLKSLRNNKILFKCLHIEHISDTRLFRFSHDHSKWGLVDDTGKIIASDRYRSISFRSCE